MKPAGVWRALVLEETKCLKTQSLTNIVPMQLERMETHERVSEPGNALK